MRPDTTAAVSTALLAAADGVDGRRDRRRIIPPSHDGQAHAELVEAQDRQLRDGRHRKQSELLRAEHSRQRNADRQGAEPRDDRVADAPAERAGPLCIVGRAASLIAVDGRAGARARTQLATCSCCSTVRCGNIGRDKIRSAAASVTGN